jgi:two-component system chemotaxis response regulator CheY
MNVQLLLVGDDPDYKELLKVRFEVLGCQVQAPLSLAELKVFSGQKWDLVVSDSQFQGLDSEKLFELLKPQVNHVFLYTQNQSMEDAPQWKGMGVKEVFSKLRRSDLVKAVQNRVEDRPGKTMAEDPAAAPKTKKFLLVDDSPTIRRFVKAVLENSFPGSRIYEAEDGKTAMRELTSQRMDLIVTDMQMPGVDGQSFINTLQKNALLSRKPILILSGMVTQLMEKEYGPIPSIKILSKPASPESIVNTINSLLR